MMQIRIIITLVIMILIFQNHQLFAVEDSTNISMGTAPKVFIDGGRIDSDYIRREVNFVNYVRDRQLADIYVMVTTQRNGSGGREYTLTFSGALEYAGTVDTMVFNTRGFDTEDEVRNKFAQNFKLGLIPFLLHTTIAENLTIEYNGNGNIEKVKDGWDYWVFRLRLNGSVRGEEIRDNYYLSGEFDVDRITEEWKIRIDGYVDYDNETYKIEEDSTWTTDALSWGSGSDVVKSISPHWSIGIFANIYSSTYRNIDFSYRLAPSIEYNIFPYSESTYHQIRISYFLGPTYRWYIDKTIYDKTEEALIQQGLRANVEITQPWGKIDISGQYTNYLHDLSKRRLYLRGWLSINLFKGFSFDFGGQFSKIHDQLNLPARDLTIEEILLRRAELATQYTYRLSFGISYRFGAIYNNIVNPRFGD